MTFEVILNKIKYLRIHIVSILEKSLKDTALNKYHNAEKDDLKSKDELCDL